MRIMEPVETRPKCNGFMTSNVNWSPLMPYQYHINISSILLILNSFEAFFDTRLAFYTPSALLDHFDSGNKACTTMDF